jgi:hypothetical protein
MAVPGGTHSIDFLNCRAWLISAAAGASAARQPRPSIKLDMIPMH